MQEMRLKTDNSPGASWDRDLIRGKTESLYLYHSSKWAGRLAELLHYKPVYFSVYKDNELQALLLGFIEPMRISSLLRMRNNFVWYGQPVYFTEDGREVHAFLAHSLNDFIKTNRLRLSRGEWAVSYKDLLPEEWRMKPWATLKIDLAPGIDFLFSSLKHSARKELRKADDAGIEVRMIENIEQLREYYGFACRCAKRYNKKMFGFKDFLTMWKFFRDWGHFETFVAFHSGRMISGLSVWGDKYNVSEIGSFQSEECFNMKWGGPDAVKWQAIKWSKSVGVRSFDLGGVNPLPGTKKEGGIRRFKEKWSGKEYQYLMVSS